MFRIKYVFPRITPRQDGLRILAAQPVLLQPQAEDALADAQLLAERVLAEPLPQMQSDGPELTSR